MKNTPLLTREINGQTFAIVHIAKTGITDFPVENLAGLKSEWRAASIDEIMAERSALRGALLAVAEAATDALTAL